VTGARAGRAARAAAPQRAPAAAAWRAMGQADLAAVATLARAVHAAYPERDAVFAERLALFARGCLVLERAGRVQGYAIAHPWRRAAPPALDTLLGALPRRPDCLYLHDVALRPAARGAGASRVALARLAAVARRDGLARIALVALPGTEGFWRRHGFAPVARPRLAAKLASYGAGACAMERELVA
jgi:GNAT superfamily N-acetyltransferase